MTDCSSIASDRLAGTGLVPYAPRRLSVMVRAAVMACVVLAAGVAAAQEPPQQPPRPPAPPATVDAPAVAPDLPPGPSLQPGIFLDALGRWLGDSKARIDEQLKNTQDALGGLGTQATDAAKDAAGAARDAAGAAGAAAALPGAMVGLPGARLVVGRERCPPSANGAPDCTPAANALCRSKGYAAGRSVDINATQKCPAWVWWSGRQPTDAECVPETFVLKAMCQ